MLAERVKGVILWAKIFIKLRIDRDQFFVLSWILPKRFNYHISTWQNFKRYQLDTNDIVHFCSLENTCIRTSASVPNMNLNISSIQARTAYRDKKLKYKIFRFKIKLEHTWLNLQANTSKDIVLYFSRHLHVPFKKVENV